MQIRFTQAFGTYGKGAVADLPEQVAQNLVRAGAASSSDVEPAILTTEAYKPARTIRKTISKAL